MSGLERGGRIRLLASIQVVLFTLYIALPIGAFAGADPTISSDLLDYNPGGRVTLTGANWQGDETVSIRVNDDIGDIWVYDANVAVAPDGSISHSFNLPSTFVALYRVRATGDQTNREAFTTFTDANPSANLDQCANDPAPSPHTDGCNLAATQWDNGNLGASKSVYFEGDYIPYRLLFDNLSGALHTVTIEWDTTKNGKHAIDFIGTYNASVANANPCLGVSGCTLATNTTFAIPKDPQVDNGSGSPIAQASGAFTMWGATINSVGRPGNVGSTTCTSANSLGSYCYSSGTGFSGDKSAAITISFTPTVANPVLAWGGHIATRAAWGLSNSAISISGSPYHTRLIDLDGSGGNQDRSLSADAVIFPASITIIKNATPDGSTSFGFTASPSPLTGFSLVDDGTSANTRVFSGITAFSNDQGGSNYVVNESSIPAGWGFDSVSCSSSNSNGGSYTTTSTQVSIDLREGADWTCTYLDSPRVGTLIVIKHVVNDDGGNATADEWSIHVKAGSSEVTGSPQNGAESPGTSYTLIGGTYNVSETGGPAGYSGPTFSGDCDSSGNVTVVVGQSKTCTLINDDVAPTLKLVKSVTNDGGGNAVADDWTLSATSKGSDASRNFSNLGGSGIFETVFANTVYDLAESSVTGYTAGSWSCDGGTQVGATISLAEGETGVTCTITNDDVAPTLHLRKVVVNDNGGTATVADFTLSANGTGANDLSGTSPVDSGTGLQADTWALSETGPAGYSASAWVCVGGTQDGNNITVGIGGEATCTITNDDLPGTIIVQKITKPAGASTSFNFQTTGDGGANALPDYQAFSLLGGTQNSQTLDAGSYTVKELVPLGWVLTGIGGSTDPNTPYNCTVTGSGGSTGVGDLNTQTATISLKNGDTVTCVFENTGQGVTRTQGFWATHPQLAEIAWFGGTDFGHTFAGVAATAGIGDTTLCNPVTKDINTLPRLMGAFWSNISKKTTGAKRSALDQARMQLLQQLIAAELNASAFGSVPSSGSFAAWEAAYCGTNQSAIKTAQQQAASFNTAGDSGAFTPGTSADSKRARAIAKEVFWNVLP